MEQDRMDVSFVEGEVLRVDEDVIQIKNHIMTYHVSEDLINQILEDGWGVVEAKGHEQIFKVAGKSVKGSLPLITLPNADQMVGVP